MKSKQLRILVASGNPHKVVEIGAVFEQLRQEAGEETGRGLAVELCSLQEVGKVIPEPVEDGETFEANAVKKARHYARGAGLLTIADDSGLEVDVLGGRPGVYSARYAGLEGERGVVDAENNKKLLGEMRGVEAGRRGARFVCTMALVKPEGRGGDEDVLTVIRGTVEGRILTEQECGDIHRPWKGRGSNGFGYDPLFFHPASGCTTAELSSEAKNAISHRGQASRLMWARLLRLFLPGDC